MTNEEKMEMLALMQEVVKPLHDDITGLKQDMADVKQVQRNSVASDNEIKQKLGVLLDGMQGIQDRFDRQDDTERRVDALEDRVSAIEYTVKK